MTTPLKNLPYPIRSRHDASLQRSLVWKILKILILCGLAFAVYQCGAEMWRHEVNKPLPPAITEKQRAYVREIEKRFSLVHHTWSVETPGRTVSLWYKGKWRIVN